VLVRLEPGTTNPTVVHNRIHEEKGTTIMRLTESLIAAAVSGIVLGATGCQENAPPPATGATPAAATPAAANAPAATPAAATTPAAPGAKHACKGQNGCKGQGGCKTDKNSCKGQNNCKGQGGCKTG
jgi:hypothetical protein